MPFIYRHISHIKIYRIVIIIIVNHFNKLTDKFRVLVKKKMLRFAVEF